MRWFPLGILALNRSNKEEILASHIDVDLGSGWVGAEQRTKTQFFFQGCFRPDALKFIFKLYQLSSFDTFLKV